MTALRSYPIIGAVIAQLVAGAVLIAIRLAFAGVIDAALLFWAGLAIQCVAAAMVTRMLGLPVWWVWIGLGFPVALALGLNAGEMPAWPFGAAFVLLYLFFSNTARERVPLYLSNSQTAEALVSLMRQRGAIRFTDLGSLLLSKISGRGRISRQDIWAADIAGEDIVYAFLSPEPMPALYQKARREMKPGSLLVSNSFAVADVAADEVWELPDRRNTRLFLYEIRG